MGYLRVVAPMKPAAVTSSRGSYVANLLTNDPREVWKDSAVGSAATFDIDLGAVRSIDTIALAHVYPASAGATWSITGGAASYTTSVIKAAGALRAVDATGQQPPMSHALWAGQPLSVRYVRITVTQPAGSLPLSIGRLVIGLAFIASMNISWGASRKVVDTGTATALPNGGWATVEGVRKGNFTWTFSDLTQAEEDALYDVQRRVGETGPVLVVEDPAATAGQLDRIHYGKLDRLKAFERRNIAQTRIEMTVEDWGAIEID